MGLSGGDQCVGAALPVRHPLGLAGSMLRSGHGGYRTQLRVLRPAAALWCLRLHRGRVRRGLSGGRGARRACPLAARHSGAARQLGHPAHPAGRPGTDPPRPLRPSAVVTPPMRIALIASNRFPIRQPFAGGLEAHVWHLARSLTHAGHQVSLFAAPDSDPSLDCAALQVRYLELSAAASTDPSMPGPAFMADHHAYLTLMLRLARDGTDEFDVIHNHSLHHLPVAMAPTL